MNKTDDKLRSEIDANETRGERGAWAVVVGLVLEIAIALAVSFNIDTKWFDNWGAVLADCLIAGGVYAEIHFGRRASHGNAELRRRSEEKVAAANTAVFGARLIVHVPQNRQGVGIESGAGADELKNVGHGDKWIKKRPRRQARAQLEAQVQVVTSNTERLSHNHRS